MKKNYILSGVLFGLVFWLSFPVSAWSQYTYHQNGEFPKTLEEIILSDVPGTNMGVSSPVEPVLPACRPCPQIQFVYLGNCCFQVQIRRTGIISSQHNMLKMEFPLLGAGFSAQQPALSAQLSGWMHYSTSTSGNSTTLTVATMATAGLPASFEPLCNICFNPYLTTATVVTTSFSDNLGSTWNCSRKFDLRRCPPPCPPVTITSQNITCFGFNGTSYQYNFSIGLTTGPVQGTVTPPITSSLGSVSVTGFSNSGGTMASPGVTIYGQLNIPSPLSPQPTGSVTLTIPFTLSDGITICYQQITFTIPPCQPECQMTAFDTAINCVSFDQSLSLYTYSFELRFWPGCSTSWPSTYNVSLMDIQVVPSGQGSILLSSVSYVWSGVQLTLNTTAPYFTYPHCPLGHFSIMGTLTTPLQFPSQISIEMKFDISDPNPTVVHQCVVTTPLFQLPPCPCLGIVDADPDIVCEPGGSTLTLSGYTGSDNCVEWYRSETDPMGVNATDAAGNLNAGWQGPIGQGVVYNTTTLVCNPPDMVDHYWYQAVISDAACLCHPLWSQILDLEVDPVIDDLGITGDTFICDGDYTDLSVYNQVTSQISNFGCPVEWYDVTNPANPVFLNAGNTLSPTIHLGPIINSSVCQSPYYERHSYKVKICGECNETVATVFVYSKPVPTNILADEYIICWGEATILRLVDNNYCGNIHWQKFDDNSGTYLDIPGASGTTVWNTNRLIETTQYRVRFSTTPNGECPDVYSNEITVVVQMPAEATITYGPCDPAILCPDVLFHLSINPSTVVWNWCLDGNPISNTTGLIDYHAVITGTYAVCVTDPVCGDVTSNTVAVDPFQAILSGPACICFEKPPKKTVVQLTVITNCYPSGTTTYYVQVEKNGVPLPSWYQQAINGSLTLQTAVHQGDVIRIKIKGNCGEAWTNTWVATGCECY